VNLRLAAAAGLFSALALLAACDERVVRAPPGRIEFTLTRLDGAPVSSAEWRNRTVVLNVWASWCAPCRAEMASLEALSRALDPARAIVVGITVDEDLNLAREYLLREGITFANLANGTTRVVRDRLQVTSLPATLVLGPDGSLRARIVGPRDWTDPGLLADLELAQLRAGAPRRDEPSARARPQLPAT